VAHWNHKRWLVHYFPVDRTDALPESRESLTDFSHTIFTHKLITKGRDEAFCTFHLWCQQPGRWGIRNRFMYNWSQTSVWTMAGRCVRSSRTVWNMSTTPSKRIRSSAMLSAMNTPVRPTPMLTFHIHTANTSTYFNNITPDLTQENSDCSEKKDSQIILWHLKTSPSAVLCQFCVFVPSHIININTQRKQK